MQIEYTATAEVRAVIEALGRTEDVRFSPSQRRLAVAGFAKDKLLFLGIDIAATASGKQVTLTDCVEVTSPSLHGPHGISFIDEDTVIVANREGGVPILRLPPPGAVGNAFELSAVQTIFGDEHHRLSSPGSVSVIRIDAHRHEVLICDNYAHKVTRHLIDERENLRVTSNEVLLSKGLNIPDGVAVNMGRRWIAISNHLDHNVLLYENTAKLNRDSEPDGILNNVNCPHGVRFTADDEFILVADAGAPFVNVYARDGHSWQGVRDPVNSFRSMAPRVFKRGRHNPQEGGPKGIDIDDAMNVLVTTCEYQTLAFFDLPAVLKQRDPSINWKMRTAQRKIEQFQYDLRCRLSRRK